MRRARTCHGTRGRRGTLTTSLLLASLVVVGCEQATSPDDDPTQSPTPAATTPAPSADATEQPTVEVTPTPTPDPDPTGPTPQPPGTPEATPPPPAPDGDDGNPGQVGYQVVGVADDDVLNVRAGPGTEHEIVGRLLPTATGVVVLDVRRDGWWTLLLDDGLTGFANSRYLAIDDAWTASFDDLPCAPDTSPWGSPRTSRNPASASAASFVEGHEFLESAACDRLVIRLAERRDDATAATWYASYPATSVPAGVRVTSGTNRVIVGLPGRWFDFRLGIDRADHGAAHLYAVNPMDRATRAIELLYPSERIARARFLSNPGRIVVDIRPAPHPSGIDSTPKVGRGWVLTEPALWDGSVSGTRQPITITGLGRPYEGQGYASLTRLDRPARPVEAMWSGGHNCTDDFGAPTATGDRYCFHASFSVWGEFDFTIDGLPPGRYRLTLSDECASGDEDQCAALALHHTFRIRP